MRIFIAIPISERLQDEIARYSEFYSDLPIRWLKGKNFHVTLVPPWEENDFEKIKKILKKIENTIGQQIEIVFNKVNFGPNPRSPRLIWATGKAPEKIIKLKKLLEQSLFISRNIGVNPVRSPRRALNPVREKFSNGINPSGNPRSSAFLLHLTIARFRLEDFEKFPIKEINDKIDWRETAKEFVIMQSHLSRQGADYEILERFKI